jgi:very-short-patch-repair endonuclease
MSKLIESPIEEQMLDALRRVSWRKLVVVEGISFDRLKGYATADQDLRRVFVVPQLKIGPYRADFMLACYQTGIYPTVVCLECDGHDYHKATIAQRSRDFERDLWMERKLIRPLRFSGKQITRDSYACALKAISAVTREDGPHRGFEQVCNPIIRALDNSGEAA